MDPLSVTASVIAVLQLTAEVTKYLYDIKDAPKECRQYTIEASNLQNLLTNLHYHVEDATSNDPWYTALRALNVENGPLDQYKQALEQLLSRVTIQDGLQKIKRRLIWKFSKAEAESILRRMERLKSLVSIALEMDHFKLSQAIQNTLSSVETDVATIRDIQWDAQKLQQHQAVMQWLSPSDFAAQQHDIISRKEEGTGQWFLDSAEFKAWQQGPEKTLFCPGIPGAGKTMIAAIAIDHLLKRSRNEDIGVAYLFCNYKAQLEQTSTALLAVVLKQLTQSRPDMPGTVAQMYENHQKHKIRPSIDEILGALQPVCSAYPAVYLVIDALDECTDRDGVRTKLIDKLRKLQAKTNLRLMFTSRFIPEIEEKFESDLLLEIQASEYDVRRYVAGQISRLPKCIQRNSELIQDVQDNIAEAVAGMFLLARLYVDSLLDKKTIQKAKATLQALKKGAQSLDAAYGEALKRIEGQLPGDILLAKQALSWIVYAQRPLTIQELCHALAIEPGRKVLDPEAVCDIDDVLSTCAGLVTVDTENNVIRLVHYTTQEYFERIRLRWIPNAQLDIATACITYLSMGTFLSGSCDSEEAFEARLRDNVFLEYSAQQWGRHVEPVQQSISGLALAFLYTEGLVLTAIQAAVVGKYRHSGYSQEFPSWTNGLHLVAKYGLSHLAEMLLEKLGYGLRVNARDSYGRTPLSWAAAGGHEAVVRLLVRRDDVEADAKDDYYGQTPLSLAATGGHEAVVRLLVERDDVEADTKDDFYGQTPLSWAAEGGHEAVVRLLVEWDHIEANAKDEVGRTPLSRAAAGGHEAVVRLLAERDDVEADAKDIYGRTPLSWAAANGHEAVVWLLAERHDVEADAKDIYGRTPLSHAAGHGEEAVVRLLESVIANTELVQVQEGNPPSPPTT